MARSWTLVRPVEESDWPQVHDLWREAGGELPIGVDAIVGRPLDVERLRPVLESSGVTVLVAAHDERLVGLVVLTASPLTGLVDNASMTVELLYVTPSARGRGAGSQLLAKAASVAEALGATQVASTAPAALRSANRFYARLGFNAAVTRRVVATAALRRRLSPDTGLVTDKVVARRRSLRARARAAGLRSADALGLHEGVSGRHAV